MWLTSNTHEDGIIIKKTSQTRAKVSGTGHRVTPAFVVIPSKGQRTGFSGII